jgi:hypothetical protein
VCWDATVALTQRLAHTQLRETHCRNRSKTFRHGTGIKRPYITCVHQASDIITTEKGKEWFIDQSHCQREQYV